MAERDQPVQVVVGALDRHAAHRDVLAEMLAALGQHDAERARRDLGVLEEQLVEVAHPVEQQAIGIGRLDLDDTAPSSAWREPALSAGGPDSKPGGVRGRATSMAPRR